MNEWKLCTMYRNLPHAKLKRGHVTMLHQTTKERMSLSSYQLAINSENIVMVMKSVIPRALLHLERLVHLRRFDLFNILARNFFTSTATLSPSYKLHHRHRSGLVAFPWAAFSKHSGFHSEWVAVVTSVKASHSEQTWGNFFDEEYWHRSSSFCFLCKVSKNRGVEKEQRKWQCLVRIPTLTCFSFLYLLKTSKLSNGQSTVFNNHTSLGDFQIQLVCNDAVRWMVFNDPTGTDITWLL